MSVKITDEGFRVDFANPAMNATLRYWAYESGRMAEGRTFDEWLAAVEPMMRQAFEIGIAVGPTTEGDR